MMKIFHLSSCSTCQRIIREINHEAKFVYQDIKSEAITAAQLDELKEKIGSYEALFSRRAVKYRTLNLKTKTLSEADYRRLILEEYTFLKRPVIVIDELVLAGNAKKTVEQAKRRLDHSSTD